MEIIAKAVQFIAWGFGQLFFPIFFHWKIIGQENLKSLKPPLIVAFNHSSWLDPFLIMAAISPRSKIVPIHFAVWPGHFYKPLFFPFLLLSGAFPVRKHIELKNTLKKPIQILKNKGVVGIAPEGKRRHLGRPRKGRRGPAFLALQTEAPILPIYLDGVLGFESQPLLSRKRKIRVVIGKSFSVPARRIRKLKDLNVPADLIRDKIFALEESKT